MLYPPELQIKLADYRNHVDDADWVRALEGDCLAFYRNEMRVYGRLRPDAYPNVFPVTATTKPTPAPRPMSKVPLQSMSSRVSRLFAMVKRWCRSTPA